MPALQRPPARDGVTASRFQLPPGEWATVLDGLAARFPAISRAVWADRIARGCVLDEQRVQVTESTPYRVGAEIYYWRELPFEARIAAEESVLYADEHLLVVDKPHGLPVTPAGDAVAETLLARLVRRLGHPHLVPLHRLDRDTAGLVLFSLRPDSRARYHALFREHAIEKRYEALAPPLPALAFPMLRRSRLQRGEPFFRMCEVPGDANSETRIDVIARGPKAWRYALQPVTGRKHQLRVHMAALGAAIFNDPCYPSLSEAGALPLQLLAKSLAFVDPITDMPQRFESLIELLDEATIGADRSAGSGFA